MTQEFRRLIGAMDCCETGITESQPNAKGYVHLNLPHKKYCEECKDRGYCNELLTITEKTLNRRLEVAEILSKRRNYERTLISDGR